jgi:hypothetical protein
MGSGDCRREAAVLDGGSIRSSTVQPPKRGFPESPPPGIESQDRAIPGDYDQVIVQRQSDAIRIGTT